MFHHVWAIVILLSIVFSLSVQGANQTHDPSPTMLSASDQALQTLQSKSDGAWKVLKNKDTGLPRMLMGAKSAVYGTNALQTAQNFLADFSDLFLPCNGEKPQNERAVLRVSSTRSLPGSAVVEFHEEYKGITVYGASVIIMVDSTGRVVHVTSTADPRVTVPTNFAKTFPEIDLILKNSQTNKALRFTASTNALVVLPGDKPQLAYQAFYKVGDSDEPWAYLFDAVTGQTLKAIRLVQEDEIRPGAKTKEGTQTSGDAEPGANLDSALSTATKLLGGDAGATNYAVYDSPAFREGEDAVVDDYCDSSANSSSTWNIKRLPQQSAIHAELSPTKSDVASSRSLVFDPNPVNTLNNTSLIGQHNVDAPVFSNAYIEVDLTHLTVPPAGGLYQLIGDFVKMEHIEDPPNTPPSSPNPVFPYHRNKPEFEEVMCYYHVTRNQEYIQSLGFTNINHRPQRIDAHGLNGVTNALAHYRASPVGSGYMAFRDGEVDSAEDADVILHEYGHSIQDNSTVGKYLYSNDRGYGDETGAMGEGFADYWACSCTYAQSVANGFDPTILGEWVESPYSSRRVNPGKHYPEDMTNEVHRSGQIWSASLWDIFKEIGKEPSDTIILASHFLVPTSPSFEDGAYAVLAADTLLYHTAHFAKIQNIFVARGILTNDTSAMLPGTLQFLSSTYSVNENVGTVTITVMRTGGSLGAATVNYATTNGTAMAGSDYTTTSGTLNWVSGETAPKTFTVTISDDTIQEGDEIFTVTLSEATGASLGAPSLSTVTIANDATPHGSVQFSSADFSVNEYGGTVTITVTRTNGSYGAASVNYATTNGTATAGSDYTATSGSLNWAAGETTPKKFTIPILDDTIQEGNEVFYVKMGTVSGVRLGSPAMATVTILDDDGGIYGGGVWPSSSTGTSSPNNSHFDREGTVPGKSSQGENARSGTFPNGGRTTSSASGSFMGGSELPSPSVSQPAKHAYPDSAQRAGTPNIKGATENISEANWTPVQISLFPPFQVFSSEEAVIGVRVNLLTGYNAHMTGLDVGIVANQVDDMRGLQVAIGNQALSCAGIQVGLANQIGYLGPPQPEAHVQTVQPAKQGANRGLQIGLMNSVGATSPLSPAETPRSSFSGMQIGVMNFADDVDGVQVGILANKAGVISGLQLSLLWNQARVLHGVQIGLINSADNCPWADFLGGVPVINAAF